MNCVVYGTCAYLARWSTCEWGLRASLRSDPRIDLNCRSIRQSVGHLWIHMYVYLMGWHNNKQGDTVISQQWSRKTRGAAAMWMSVKQWMHEESQRFDYCKNVPHLNPQLYIKMAVEQILHCNIDLGSVQPAYVMAAPWGAGWYIWSWCWKDVITVCTINMGTKGVDLQGDAEHRGGV